MYDENVGVKKISIVSRSINSNLTPTADFLDL